MEDCYVNYMRAGFVKFQEERVGAEEKELSENQFPYHPFHHHSRLDCTFLYIIFASKKQDVSRETLHNMESSL